MNQIEKLIQQYCPEGVEYIEIGRLLNYEQPSKYLVRSTDYNDNHSTPVLTAGQTFILGYTDEITGIYEADKSNPVIIFDDFTTSFHWVDFRFKVKSSAMKLITPNRERQINFRFVFYAMKCIRYAPQDHSRQWISIYSKFLIPVPPLPVQEAIVSILDKFTSLEAELEAELEARRAQYDYYRNQLLTPVKVGDKWMLNGVEVEWKTLDQISKNLDSKRKPVKSSAREKGQYPYYGASGVVDYVIDYIFEGDYLLISEDGANLVVRNTPIAFSISGKTWVNNHAHVLEFDSYATRRITEFYINLVDISEFVLGGAQPKLNQKNLNKIKIPIPPLPEQERIVSILDKFDSLVNDISIGLPAEIEARRKQYEYYRERLLAFKEAEPQIEAG